MKTNILLVSEQMPYFKSVALRSLPSRYIHLAEDLAQDAIMKSIEKIHLYDASKGNFKSWLFKLTQNLCFDAVRKLDKMNIVPMSIELLHNKSDHSKEIHHAELKVIRRAMKHLNDRDRQLILYKFVFNLSGKEMAQLLEIPEAQINTYFKRAKMRLVELCEKAA